MNIYLDDSLCKNALRPFTYTRHTADIRVGILTIREKWEHISGLSVTKELSEINEHTVKINAAIIPSISSVETIFRCSIENLPIPDESNKRLVYPWNIFQYNDWAIREDFNLITTGRASQVLPVSNQLIGSAQNLFIEEGASVECSIINTNTGPVYIGKNALVMEGSMIRGPFTMGEKAVLKMGSKVYGATTLGPNCVGGGEIKNSVLFANSNKAHDGYLGDSVIGEWCNLGAGTSNSNVKNTGGNVKYFIDDGAREIVVGNKAGLLMGDYSRAAINSSFNTGSVVGVCCNVFGTAPEKFINNFSWGIEQYIFEKAIADIDNWKQMKGANISEAEVELLKKIYKNTQ